MFPKFCHGPILLSRPVVVHGTVIQKAIVDPEPKP